MEKIKEYLIKRILGVVSKTSKRFSTSMNNIHLARAMSFFIILLLSITFASAGNVTMKLGNLTADYFIGDGSLLTNLHESIPDQGISTEGVAGYWPFDKDSEDYSGNGNNGAATGTTKTEGKIGMAYNFDGDDYITVPDNDMLNLNNTGTIAFWFNYSGGNYNTFISKRNLGGNGYHMGVEYNQQMVLVVDNGPQCGVGYGHPTPIRAKPDMWHFVAMTWDTAATTVKIYFDDNRTFTNSTCLSTGSIGNKISVGIGRRPDGTGQYLTGKLDEVMIWNRTLSADEISTLYRVTGPISVKEAYYKKSDSLPETGGNTSAEIAQVCRSYPTGNTTSQIATVVRNYKTGNTTNEITTVIRNYPTGNTTAQLTAFLNTNRSKNVKYQNNVKIFGELNVTRKVSIGNRSLTFIKSVLFVNGSSTGYPAGWFYSKNDEAIYAETDAQVYRAIHAVAADANSWGVLSSGGACDYKAATGGTTDYCSSSSIKYKTNVQNLSSSLSKVNQLRPISYDIKPEYGAGKGIGLIAEEVELIVPEVVAYGMDEDGDKELTPSIDYSRLVPVLIGAVQELQTENNLLMKELCSKDNSYTFC